MIHLRSIGDLVQRAHEPFADWIDGPLPEEFSEAEKQTIREYDRDWAGGRSLSEACAYLLRGATATEVHQVGDLARTIRDLPRPTASWGWEQAVAGATPDVAAWLSGRPDAMRTIVEQPGHHRTRRLIFFACVPGVVAAEDIQRAGLTAAALAKRLGECCPLEFYFAAVCTVIGTDREVGWCLRADGLPADKIVAIGATSTLRLVGPNLMTREAGSSQARLRIAAGGHLLHDPGFDAAVVRACGFDEATVLYIDTPFREIIRRVVMSESFEDAIKTVTTMEQAPSAEEPKAATEAETAGGAEASDTEDDIGLDSTMSQEELSAAQAALSDAEREAISEEARQAKARADAIDEKTETGDIPRSEIQRGAEAFVASLETAQQEPEKPAPTRLPAFELFPSAPASAPAPSTAAASIFGAAPVQDDVDVKDVAAQAAAKAASTIVARAPDVARASMEAAEKARAAAMEAAAAARRAAGEMARKSMHRIPWRKVGLIAGGVVVIGAAASAAVHFMHAHQATPAASAPAVAPPAPAPAPAPKPAVATAHPATPAPVPPQRESVPSAPAPKPAPAPAPAPATAPAVSKPAAPARAPASQNSAAAEPRVRKPARRAMPKPSIDAKSKAQIQALETFFKQNGGGH